MDRTKLEKEIKELRTLAEEQVEGADLYNQIADGLQDILDGKVYTYKEVKEDIRKKMEKCS